MQDNLGISRKKWKFTISPKAFIMIKIALILLIPIFYFVYSPLLILIMSAYVGLFFLSIMAEHSMNKSVVKSNHIHFSKFDSALALIIIVIAFASSVSSVFKQSTNASFENFNSTEVSKMVGDRGFKGAKRFAKKSQYKTIFIDFCSLLTGERNIFESEKEISKFNFGTMSPPEDFVSNPDDVSFPKFDGNGKGSRPQPMDIMDNIPIAYVTNSMMSSVSSVLIFSVSIFGAISLIAVYIKKQKMDRVMNEVVLEGKIEMLSDKEMIRILSFGEDAGIGLNQDELNRKIEIEHQQTLESEADFEIVNNLSTNSEECDEIELLRDDYILK